MAFLEGQLHGGALEEGRQTYPGYLVVATSAVGLLLSSKAKEGGLLNTAVAGLLNSIYVAKLALLILPQVSSGASCSMHSTCNNLFLVIKNMRSIGFSGLSLFLSHSMPAKCLHDLLCDLANNQTCKNGGRMADPLKHAVGSWSSKLAHTLEFHE